MSHLQRLARAQALGSNHINKGNFDGLLDSDDFVGIEDGMVDALFDSDGIDKGSFDG
jgi:hypothetical protein